MKIINLSKKFFIFIIYFLFSLNNYSYSLTLEKTSVTLDNPWGMSWMDDNNLLITQKSGEIFNVNTKPFGMDSWAVSSFHFPNNCLVNILSFCPKATKEIQLKIIVNKILLITNLYYNALKFQFKKFNIIPP